MGNTTVQVRDTVKDPQKAFHYTDTMSRKPTRDSDHYEYMSGFGNRFQSEVIPGTLPIGQNHPQEVRFGLYTEGLTYSSFMAPRQSNISTFAYRARPSMCHDGYKSEFEHKADIENSFLSINPNVTTWSPRCEWAPFTLPQGTEKRDFVDGLHTLAGSGDPNLREGVAQYVYMLNESMDHRAFCNADGDLLFVPQLGDLDIQTELGKIFLQPGEICVIPRGIRFAVRLGSGVDAARGYVTEIWGSRWELPELGPLGGHGLANPRDFLYPVAHVDENLHGSWSIVNKVNGNFNALGQDHSPFDVVAWHGNYAPYKYDLTKFVAQNSVTVDHTDPSIYCVLTAKSRDPATALVDFLRIGPRWDAISNSFRPPYFHRNAASEFMAMIWGGAPGGNDAMSPGGGYLEISHTPHGVDSKGITAEMRNQVTQPRVIMQNQMGFMVETSRTFLVTEYARVGCGTFKELQTPDWSHLPDNFSSYPNIKNILNHVNAEKETRKSRDNAFLDDSQLENLVSNGVSK